jgi:triosephosphate isomerase
MGDRIPLIAGNWKMNLDLDQATGLVQAIISSIGGLKGVEVLVAPPFILIPAVKKAIGDSLILLAAQNMHWEEGGAFTGEVSGDMIKEAGCTHVILGHSERRTLFKETSEIIDLKVKSAIKIGLIPIICIGETLEEREAGKTFEIIETQLNESLKGFKEAKKIPESTILAYEPVWAIGTGKTATPGQAQEVHGLIRNWIEKNFDSNMAQQIRILYGGSVKPDNVKDLMSQPDIDGALVGGASLKADSFLKLVRFQET